MRKLLLFVVLFSQSAMAQDEAARERAIADHGPPDSFPHRIWAASDFEGPLQGYHWFGPVSKADVPKYPGNTSVMGVAAKPYKNVSAVMTGINPVPGPRMGTENGLYLSTRPKL